MVIVMVTMVRMVEHLAAREEEDSRNSGGNVSWQGEQGQWGDLVVDIGRQKDHLQEHSDDLITNNLLWVGLAFTLGSTGHHIRLEEGALGDWSDNWSWKDFHLKEDMMVSQCLVNCCQYHLRHLEIFFTKYEEKIN